MRATQTQMRAWFGHQAIVRQLYSRWPSFGATKYLGWTRKYYWLLCPLHWMPTHGCTCTMPSADKPLVCSMWFFSPRRPYFSGFQSSLLGTSQKCLKGSSGRNQARTISPPQPAPIQTEALHMYCTSELPFQRTYFPSFLLYQLPSIKIFGIKTVVKRTSLVSKVCEKSHSWK